MELEVINIFLVDKQRFFLLFFVSSNNVFFYLSKFISYQIMVRHDPNYGNMYFNCSSVREVVSGLLTPRSHKKLTEN